MLLSTYKFTKLIGFMASIKHNYRVLQSYFAEEPTLSISNRLSQFFLICGTLLIVSLGKISNSPLFFIYGIGFVVSSVFYELYIIGSSFYILYRVILSGGGILKGLIFIKLFNKFIIAVGVSILVGSCGIEGLCGIPIGQTALHIYNLIR